MDVNGVPTIIGATSFGTSTDTNICTDGWDTRVELYLDFIDPFSSTRSSTPRSERWLGAARGHPTRPRRADRGAATGPAARRSPGRV
ncbi:hypothetical protein ACMHYB_01285 [Sorangium sp. So ce1128]